MAVKNNGLSESTIKIAKKSYDTTKRSIRLQIGINIFHLLFPLVEIF